MGFKAFHPLPRGSIVESGSGILRPPVDRDIDVLKQHVFNGLISLPINSDTVFPSSANVAQANVTQPAYLAILGPRPRSDGDRFTPSPPARRVMLSTYFDISELYIFDVPRLPMRNRRPPSTGNDLATLKQDLRNVAERFGTNFQTAVARSTDAVLDHDIAARSVVFGLLARLDHHGVVGADDIAIANLHIAAMIRVNPIAIRYIYVVPDTQPVHQYALASQQLHTPLG